MAKTPKLKKREVSVHSRAARRGEEPPAKDLAVKTTAVEESDYKPWLHSAQNAGISKKKKAKTLTHSQKVRQQKAMEKAEMDADRLEKKVGDSKQRARKVQARRSDWEDLNGKTVTVKDAKKESKSTKSGEDVVLPDLEQPLPLRTTDVSTTEDALEEIAQQDGRTADEPDEDDVI